MHRYNWHCMMLITLMVSQKLWDDLSLNNVDFPQVWRMVAPKGGELNLKDINFMEKEFLAIIKYRVTVGMTTYTSCYYEVMALAIANDEDAIDKMEKEKEANVALARFRTSSFHVVLSDSSAKQSTKVQELLKKSEEKLNLNLNLKKKKKKKKSSKKRNDDDDDSDDDEEEEDDRRAQFKQRRNTAEVFTRTPLGSQMNLEI